MNIAIRLYNATTLANGEHPLVLRISHKGKRKYLPLGVTCPASLWNFKLNRPTKDHDYKEWIEFIMASTLKRYKDEYRAMVAANKPISPEALVRILDESGERTMFFNKLSDKMVHNVVERMVNKPS